MTTNSVRAASILENLEGRRLLTTNLVSDAAGLLPTDAVRAGGYNYFFANDGTHGRELWKSDGTAAGTTLAADVTAGAKGTEAYNLTQAGDKVLFFTRTAGATRQHVPSYNYTLWSSDGTDAGTTALATYKNVLLLKTQNTGDRVVFSIYTRDAAGNEYSGLFGTDGTAVGTAALKTFTMDADAGGSVLINSFYDVGDRAVARVGSDQLWSSDGTAAGTVDLTAAVASSNSSGLDSAQFQVDGGRLAIIGNNGASLWTTDGTVAGTVHRTLGLDGHLDGFGADAAVLNGVAYVVNVNSAANGNDIEKVVYGVNLTTGKLTRVYSPAGDASAHRITVSTMAGGIGITDQDGENQSSKFLVSDGTEAGTKVIESSVTSAVLSTAELDGVLYTVRLARNYSDDNGGLIGSRTDADGGLMITGGGSQSTVELWRSDGTAAGTGRVRTLLAANTAGSFHYFTLSTADGKLVLRSESGAYTPPAKGQPYTFPTEAEVDDTTVYDPSELTPGREAAAARLVNGVLRIGGSLGDDNILIYRRASDPGQLVVEYNGNTRVFATGDVTRIKADLQGGADRFELREGDEGFLRLRTSVSGGDGDDTIITASGRDTISGGNGSDKIYAGRGADQISGGAGGDRINGQSGNDQITGGSGRDRITSGGGVDVLFGMSAVEMAFGTNADGQSYLNDVLLT